jgi:uncharacterized protein YutE (UPF0331/DUF86 family)
VRLQRLEEVLAELIELGRLDPEVLRNRQRDMWAVERGLQLGAEIIFDIGNHILSASFGVNPEGYENIVQELATQGVLDAELRQRLRGLAGFRNVLVHDYLRLDPNLVLQGLARAPQDFGDFARAIRSWLRGQTED